MTTLEMVQKVHHLEQFYISPKIDKEWNPGRPVVSSLNCDL